MAEKDIFIKLIEIQNSLHVPKNQFNKFGNYNFRSCEDILEAVKPLCQERNLLLYLTDEIVLIGSRFYVKAKATLTDGSDTICTTAYAREDENKKGMDGSQVTGSSSSYARKYALNGMFNIDDNKDADTNEQHKQQQAAQQEQKQQKQQEQKPSRITCPRCQKQIEPIKTAKGSTWQPQHILKKYGMCKDCYLKQKLENEVKGDK